jgi:hypothetical protein
VPDLGGQQRDDEQEADDDPHHIGERDVRGPPAESGGNSLSQPNEPWFLRQPGLVLPFGIPEGGWHFGTR